MSEITQYSLSSQCEEWECRRQSFVSDTCTGPFCIPSSPASPASPAVTLFPPVPGRTASDSSTATICSSFSAFSISDQQEPSINPLLGCTILLVDDDACLRKVNCAVLSKFGAHVLTASSADEGIAMLRSSWCKGPRPSRNRKDSAVPTPPQSPQIGSESPSSQGPIDLVLMDLNMPNKDGITATREIRSMEAAGVLCPPPGLSQPDRTSLPIWGWTTEDTEERVRTWMAAGADGVIGKPLLGPKLKAALVEAFATPSPKAASDAGYDGDVELN